MQAPCLPAGRARGNLGEDCLLLTHIIMLGLLQEPIVYVYPHFHESFPCAIAITMTH